MMFPSRLPPLRGWFFSLYRVLWVVAFTVAVLSNSWFFYRYNMQAREGERAAYAVGIEGIGGGYVAPVTSDARKSGILPGDRLVAVDGHSFVGTSRAAFGPVFHRPQSAPIVLDLISPSKVRHRAILAYLPSRVDDIYSGSGISFTAQEWVRYLGFQLCNSFMLAAAGLLFFRRPRDPVAALISHAAYPQQLLSWHDLSRRP